MRNPNAIFPVPFFIEPIDLEKIYFKSNEVEYQPSFMSGIPTTLGHDYLSDESYQYLHGIIGECIGQFLDDPFVIGQTWRNKYTKSDWQDPHIHSGAQWSFIIYVSVTEGRTVFMNPSRGLIMNQWAMYGNVIPMDFVPQVPDGHILIFPSWIEHFAMSGNEGETIAGNVYLREPPIGLRDERKTRQSSNDE